MSSPIVRIMVVFGVVVLFASAVYLIYPLLRSRAPGIGSLARALFICILAGVPLAYLGAQMFDPLRPGLGGQVVNRLGVFPAGEGLTALLVRVAGIQDIATPNLWTGLGAGAGLGAALAIAVRSLLDAPSNSWTSDMKESGAKSGLFVVVSGILLVIGAIVVPIVGEVAYSSKSPPVVMQLVPGDEAVVGFGVGISFGVIIASSAASLIDLAGAFIARVTGGGKGTSRDKGGAARPGLSAGLGAFTPLVFWVTAGIAAIVISISQQIASQNWLNLVGVVVASPLILIIVAIPGILASLASGLRVTIAAGVGERSWSAGFDWYALAGGAIFGLILAGGSHVPLLGWLFGVIGTLGWAGLLVGVVFGLVLALLPLITRVLLALPNLAWIIFGFALVAVGGILVLTPTWLS